MIWNQMEKSAWLGIQRKSCFHWRKTEPFRKSCYSGGRNKIGNLEDLPRLVFIDKEWWKPD